MGLISNLNEFVPGTPILASQVNSNFDAIVAVVNGDISEENLRNLGVTTSALANSAVTADKIRDGAVVAGKLGPSAVSTDDIADTAITASKMAANAVGTDTLMDGAVTVSKSARLTHQVISSSIVLDMSHMDSTLLIDGPHEVILGDALPVGSIVELVQWGEESPTITGGVGVTMRTATGNDSVIIAHRYTSATARKISAGEWLVQGAVV